MQVTILRRKYSIIVFEKFRYGDRTRNAMRWNSLDFVSNSTRANISQIAPVPVTEAIPEALYDIDVIASIRARWRTPEKVLERNMIIMQPGHREDTKRTKKVPNGARGTPSTNHRLEKYKYLWHNSTYGGLPWTMPSRRVSGSSNVLGVEKQAYRRRESRRGRT